MEPAVFLQWIRKHPDEHQTLQNLGDATETELCELLFSLELAELNELALFVLTANCWNAEANLALKNAWLGYLGGNLTDTDLHQLARNVIETLTP